MLQLFKSKIRFLILLVFVGIANLLFLNLIGNPSNNNPSAINSDQKQTSTDELLGDEINNDTNKSELRQIWVQNRKFPFLMSFKAFEGVNTTLKNGNPDPFYLNLLNSLVDYRWIHGPGSGNDDHLQKSADIASKISGDLSGVDYWGKPAHSKVFTRQMAYGGVSISDTNYIWPGHVLYMAGTKVSKIDVDDQGQTYLTVSDPSVIGKQKSFDYFNNDKGNAFVIIVYPLLQDGKPDWELSEWMQVTSFDKINSRFKVNRSTWRDTFWSIIENGTRVPLKGFTSRPDHASFNNAAKNGKLVAAVPMRFWSHQLQLNFSLLSPVTPPDLHDYNSVNDYTPYPVAGEMAVDWYARRVQKEVITAHAQGVEFDVGRWTWGNQENAPMDINNDLAVDHGYLNGINLFGLGGSLFFKKLRNLLGPNKIIQADSVNIFTGVRDWNYLNGSQQESFPSANDFDRFSQAFLQLRMWVRRAGQSPELGYRVPPLSYAFIKTPTESVNGCTVKGQNGFLIPYTSEEIPKQCLDKNGNRIPHYKGYNRRFRSVLAAGALTRTATPYLALATDGFDPYTDNISNSTEITGLFNWDEYRGGDLNIGEWLGKATENLKRTMDFDKVNTSSILAGSEWSWVSDVQSGFNISEQITNNGSRNQLFETRVVSLPQPSIKVLPKEFYKGVRLTTNLDVKLIPGEDYTIVFDARGDDSWSFNNFTINNVPRLLTILLPFKTSHPENPLGVMISKDWSQYMLSFVAADCSNLKESHFGCIEADGMPVSFGVSEQVGKTSIRNIRLYQGSSEKWSRSFDNGKVLLNMSNKDWVDVPLNPPEGCHYSKLKGTVDRKINNGELLTKDVVSVPPQDGLFLKKVCQ